MPALAVSEDTQADIFIAARTGELQELKEAVQQIQPEALIQVVNEYTKATPLHYAAANGHVDCVEYLLDIINSNPSLKPLVNAQNESGNTPLHWAALNGELEVVKLLCEAGAEPLLKNEAGHDSYYEAQTNEQEDIVDYLLEKYDIMPEDDEEEQANEEKKQKEEEPVEKKD